jgi:uncharacterized protein (TIGR00251 family)
LHKGFYVKFNGLIPVRVKVTTDGVIISVYVRPSAKQDKIDTKDGIEICTREPPKGNRANIAVIKMLSKVLGIPPRKISIVRGAASRVKEIHVSGINQDRLERLMQDGSGE